MLSGHQAEGNAIINPHKQKLPEGSFFVDILLLFYTNAYCILLFTNTERTLSWVAI